jgi:hypothetical protein
LNNSVYRNIDSQQLLDSESLVSEISTPESQCRMTMHINLRSNIHLQNPSIYIKSIHLSSCTWWYFTVLLSILEKSYKHIKIFRHSHVRALRNFANEIQNVAKLGPLHYTGCPKKNENYWNHLLLKLNAYQRAERNDA